MRGCHVLEMPEDHITVREGRNADRKQKPYERQKFLFMAILDWPHSQDGICDDVVHVINKISK